MGAVRKVGVFGTATRTNTLLIIHMLGETHAREVAKVLQTNLSPVQKAIESLELAGLVVGVIEGKTRRVKLNLFYPHRDELEALLTQMAADDVPLQKKLGELRRRPRRSGKEL